MREENELRPSFGTHRRDRTLWGSGMSPPGMPARDAWIAFRTLVPLTEEEFGAIARNVAPYLR